MKGNKIECTRFLLVIFLFSILNMSFSKNYDTGEKFNILEGRNFSAITPPKFTSDNVTDMLISQYKNNSISFLVNEIIEKLPTTGEKITKIEFLYTLIKDNNDTLNTNKIYEFLIHYTDLLNIYDSEGNIYYAPIYIKIPYCILNLLWYPYLCFDNGKYIITYSSTYYPIIHYSSRKGKCSPYLEDEYYWKVTKNKGFTNRDIKSLDVKARKSIIENIKFELAPPYGDECYIADTNEYVYKPENSQSQLLRYTHFKESADKWFIHGYNKKLTKFNFKIRLG